MLIAIYVSGYISTNMISLAAQFPCLQRFDMLRETFAMNKTGLRILEKYIPDPIHRRMPLLEPVGYNDKFA